MGRGYVQLFIAVNAKFLRQQAIQNSSWLYTQKLAIYRIAVQKTTIQKKYEKSESKNSGFTHKSENGYHYKLQKHNNKKHTPWLSLKYRMIKLHKMKAIKINTHNCCYNHMYILLQYYPLLVH